MTVLVDTPIWSCAYRRTQHSIQEASLIAELIDLIRREEAVFIGAICQELLSGINNDGLFEDVRTAMRGFVELSATLADYELAATYCNTCRRHGIQGSATDFLICAVANSYDATIFTTDRDFERYAQVLGIRLYQGTST
jgi:predicted nucleic acid-binding protein